MKNFFFQLSSKMFLIFHNFHREMRTNNIGEMKAATTTTTTNRTTKKKNK